MAHLEIYRSSPVQVCLLTDMWDSREFLTGTIEGKTVAPGSHVVYLQFLCAHETPLFVYQSPNPI